MRGRKACGLTVALAYISDLIDCESLGKHTGGPAGHVNNASWNKTWSPESKSFCILVWYSVIHFIRVLWKWTPPWCMTSVFFYVWRTPSGGILLGMVSTELKRVPCNLIISNTSRPGITYGSEATTLNHIVLQMSTSVHPLSPSCDSGLPRQSHLFYVQLIFIQCSVIEMLNVSVLIRQSHVK